MSISTVNRYLLEAYKLYSSELKYDLAKQYFAVNPKHYSDEIVNAYNKLLNITTIDYSDDEIIEMTDNIIAKYTGGDKN